MNTEEHLPPNQTDGWARRDFLKLVSVAGAGLVFSRMPLMAGPFDDKDWNQIIPADKKLHPDWVKSLFARGTPQTYAKANNELRYIGMAEDMVLESLAVTRAVHDRYHASRRNPWNEVECSDHYSRAMASYGTFITACGFEYHGPSGHIGFAPKLTPENFKAPFTAAEGWGSYSQIAEGGRLKTEISMRWGSLNLKTVSLAIADRADGPTVSARLGQDEIFATLKVSGQRALITFADTIKLSPQQPLRLALS